MEILVKGDRWYLTGLQTSTEQFNTWLEKELEGDFNDIEVDSDFHLENEYVRESEQSELEEDKNILSLISQLQNSIEQPPVKSSNPCKQILFW